MAQRHWTPADQPRANAQRSRGMSLEAVRCVNQPKGNNYRRSHPQHLAGVLQQRSVFQWCFRGERSNGGDPVRWLCADRARACERRVSGRRRAARRPRHTLHPEVLALLPLRAACGRT